MTSSWRTTWRRSGRSSKPDDDLKYDLAVVHDTTASTLALATTIAGLLLAVQVPLPIEMTALVMVGLVLRWSLGRQTRAANHIDARMTELEGRISKNRAEIDRQRHWKHEFRNQLSGVYATMVMMREAANRCDCEAFDPLIPVLDQIIPHLKETIEQPTAPLTLEEPSP